MWYHHVLVSVVVLTLQMDFMLTAPVEDWVVFQHIYLITLIPCKSVITTKNSMLYFTSNMQVRSDGWGWCGVVKFLNNISDDRVLGHHFL